MRFFFIVILLLIINTNVFAQNTTTKEPKVGLVLSGGGAKGLAHIGVLKVIDSLGIRIDHIAGTSMGAIIGSLYASGYSGKQLEVIFNQVNFDDIINDNIPRAAKTSYEREDTERYAISLPFDDLKIKLPSALSKGQNTYNLLTKLTLHVSHITDFNKLPIPFFCIATNIENGQPVILDKGNLAQSIKASGAFPSLFQPVIIEGQLLIDGGVTNNYPIDELKAKGMDIIIGVDVQDGLAKRTDLSSAPAILFQINNFRTINDMKTKAPKTDIYIKPDITNYSVVSFNDGEAIVNSGKVAARLISQDLLSLAKKQVKKPIVSKPIKPLDSIQINQVYFEGLNKYTKSYILGKLKLEPFKKISYAKFIEGANNLIATDNFDDFAYRLLPSKHNGIEGYDLYNKFTETKQTTNLKFGLHYDGLYKSAALVNITKRQFIFKSDVVSLDLIAGDNVRYNFDYYIDNGFSWSFGLSSSYNEFNKNIQASTFLTPEELATIGVNKVGVKISDITNRVFVQTQYKNDLTLKFGAEHKHYRVTTETVLQTLGQTRTKFDDSDYVGAFANMKFDSFDNKFFPKEGFYFNADFHLFLISSDFNNNFSQFSVLKADLGYAHKLSSKLSANLFAEAGTKINDQGNNAFDFALGGYANNFINNFKSFYGYDYLSLSADSFIKATVNLDYEIFNNHHILASANFANIDDKLFSSEDVEWFSLPDYSGYALGYGTETFLGPIEGKFTFSPETKQTYWFFNLGFWF